MKTKILCLILLFACIFAANSVSYAESYDEAIENIYNNFQSAYNSEWNQSDLSVKLFNIVDREFSQNINSLQYGTIPFQLAMNRNSIIEKIQRDIFNAFRPEYERFLGRFQETFYSSTAKNILTVMPSRKALEVVNQISYAMHHSPRFALEEEGERKLLENIWEKISPAISNPFLSIGFILLGLMLFFSKILLTKNSKRDTRLARMAVSFIGVIIMILGLYTTLRIFGNNSLTSRVVMYTNTKDFYVSELSQAYWTDIEQKIKQVLL